MRRVEMNVRHPRHETIDEIRMTGQQGIAPDSRVDVTDSAHPRYCLDHRHEYGNRWLGFSHDRSSRRGGSRSCEGPGVNIIQQTPLARNPSNSILHRHGTCTFRQCHHSLGEINGFRAFQSPAPPGTLAETMRTLRHRT